MKYFSIISVAFLLKVLLSSCLHVFRNQTTETDTLDWFSVIESFQKIPSS